MVVASGNVVHNLGQVQWRSPDAGFDWAQRFDDAVADQMTADPRNILKVSKHPDYALAVPTPDHFIPLLYIAGIAAERGGAKPLLRGYSMGSLSMTCYGVGADLAQAEGDDAAGLPAGVPPEQTNT